MNKKKGLNIEKELDELLLKAEAELKRLDEEIEEMELKINMVEVEDFLENGPGYGRGY